MVVEKVVGLVAHLYLTLIILKELTMIKGDRTW